MRKVKFRAWDKEHNFMYKVMRVAFENGITYAWREALPGEFAMHIGRSVSKEAELMQYTGLKDKNGKEIYEGDIIRTWEQEEYVPDRDSGGGIVGYDKVDGFSQLGVISYEGASFIYTTQKHLEGREEKLSAPIDWFNELVVVGNVHENPELLQ